jgi:ribosomal protein L14E/L6E/L27E
MLYSVIIKLGDILVGSLVCSKCGHDKGKIFVVFHIDNDYYYLVDGRYRLIDKPKKKKIKHVQVINYICSDVLKKIKNNSCIDFDFREAINKYRERDSSV